MPTHLKTFSQLYWWRTESRNYLTFIKWIEGNEMLLENTSDSMWVRLIFLLTEGEMSNQV